MSKSSPLAGDSAAAANLVKSKIRPTQFLMSKQPDFNKGEWQAVNNQMVCDGCWYITYHLPVKHTPLEDFVNPDWKVNLRSGAVTPARPDTAKYFDTMRQ